MTANEYTARYQFLKEPAKKATEAYEKAARFFDQLKEIVLIDFGMVNTSERIHNTAHWFPQEFDVLGDILHQRHVMQDYGATPAFNERVEDLDDVFSICVSCLEEIDTKLIDLVEIADANGAKSLGRQFETLQINVSEKCAEFLEAWQMLENARSPVSYDNWIKRYLSTENEEDDEDGGED